MHEFAPVSIIAPGTSLSGTVGIDWNDTTQPASFDIVWSVAGDNRKSSISIKPNVGELITAVTMADFLFLSEQGIVVCFHVLNNHIFNCFFLYFFV